VLVHPPFWATKATAPRLGKHCGAWTARNGNVVGRHIRTSGDLVACARRSLVRSRRDFPEFVTLTLSGIPTFLSCAKEVIIAWHFYLSRPQIHFRLFLQNLSWSYIFIGPPPVRKYKKAEGPSHPPPPPYPCFAPHHHHTTHPLLIRMPKAPKGKKARSFSGCKCCKQAKRKCPEEHPQCSICVKLGLKCEVITLTPCSPPCHPLDLGLISF
jgi:Fungal Zn(2)-Cys(6) binuclear cluster domain